MKIIGSLKQKIKDKDFIVNLFLTIFLFSLSLTPLLWFKGNQILLGYDNVYPLNPIEFLKDRIFSWTSIQGFGFDQSGQQGSLIIHFIDSLPQFFGASIQFSQKIVFSFWFFLLLLSPYIFVRTLEKNGFIKKGGYLRYIFPALYAFNFYILQAWWIAERTKFSIVVATPLILAVLIPLLVQPITKRIVIKKAIISSFILTLFNGGGWAGLSLYGGILIVLGVFYLFTLTSLALKKRKSDIILLHLFFLFFSLFFIILNAYTFLPFLLVSVKDYNSFVAIAGGISGIIDWVRYLSEHTSFINLLRLQGVPDWYNNGPYHPYAQYYLKQPLFILASFVFPALLFLSFLAKNIAHRLIILFFLAVLIFSIFFTAGTHSPLGFLFEFIISEVPGFLIFRSAFFKFGYAYWFAASFLIGIALTTILERFKNKGFKVVALLIITTLIILYHFPYLTGDIFRISPDAVYSRVTVPNYVYDFVKWWKTEGENKRILLLPKLDNNWLFEQYKWGYLSLFPLVNNFGSTSIVENTDILLPKESDLVNALYDALDKKDYKKMEQLSSVLGISHFLVRKDFYYGVLTQEIGDAPGIIEKTLVDNTNIEFVKSFGEWIVFKYKDEYPVVSVEATAIHTNRNTSGYFTFPGSPLVLDKVAYRDNPNTFSDVLIFPECLSCEAERIETEVIFPKPNILIDSSFYGLVKLRNRIRESQEKRFDEKIISLTGETLQWAGHLSELISQGKSELFINVTSDNYRQKLKEIFKEVSDIKTFSSRPYTNVVTIEQYLDAQIDFVNELIRRVNTKSIQITLDKIIFEIGGVKNELRKIYKDEDINIKKFYKVTIGSANEYSIHLVPESLGFLETEELENINISIDGNPVELTPSFDGEIIDLGNFYFSEGDHELELHLPKQKNILTSYKKEEIANNICYTSLIENITPEAYYSLQFTEKNNFDPNFFYLIDDGQRSEVTHLGVFPLLGEQTKNYQIIISSSFYNTNTVRTAFCAPNLTESLYSENIKNLSAVKLTVPEIYLYSKGNAIEESVPTINVVEMKNTHVKVSVQGANRPFYLVFSHRYSPGWQTNVGEHFVGNGFRNVWLIDQKGDFLVDINYKPQDYVYYGVFISIVSFILATTILYKLR